MLLCNLLVAVENILENGLRDNYEGVSGKGPSP